MPSSVSGGSRSLMHILKSHMPLDPRESSKAPCLDIRSKRVVLHGFGCLADAPFSPLAFLAVARGSSRPSSRRSCPAWTPSSDSGLKRLSGLISSSFMANGRINLDSPCRRLASPDWWIGCFAPIGCAGGGGAETRGASGPVRARRRIFRQTDCRTEERLLHRPPCPCTMSSALRNASRVPSGASASSACLACWSIVFPVRRSNARTARSTSAPGWAEALGCTTS
mmetsp:Transcript_678/g.1520  ORF Transcript_678/g.1520 Transcript_678/m.1520 type:complete len:225 (+) Transcript_678:1114-1788(+)